MAPPAVLDAPKTAKLHSAAAAGSSSSSSSSLLSTLAYPLLTLALAFRHLHNLLLSLVLRPVLAAALALLHGAWRRTEKFRDRCFYDFIVLLVNPNAVALVLFWPGWIVVGVAWWVFG
ncbi:hypothetical protein FGG08_000153 [Glutinoglossum americanum]|uniref:Uncharacterized protein n=1 Tax=Glutinoglossum americanum TaxID=1670608 RepID=A0A9P8IDH6_9PEZI|nr:hypothetical protein FGG08_000153 [Glutinoglossum americanum]